MFTPSTSTMLSENIVTNVSYAYTPSKASSGSIRGNVKAKPEETECPFANSFKVQADSGILACEDGLMCVEDYTSSLGGRCADPTTNNEEDLANEYEKYDEFAAAESHRQLAICTAINCSQTCTYTDGTSGVKCQGYRACQNIDPDKVGCGSCHKDYACYSRPPASRSLTVGERSCRGHYSCYSRTSTTAITIGSYSCSGDRACYEGK
jgi:hypothetical protein